MKFIIIGLGYFGGKLATLLTQQGHEVIGIDNRYERIEELKDSISIVMEMDTTSENAVKSLPLEDTDAVVVAIGEDFGSSILTLAILKNLEVKRIIGRAISPVHQRILSQMGIREIVHPEEETAFSVSSLLQLKSALKITELDSENVIAELYLPKKYQGHNLESIDLQKRFGLKLIAVKTLSRAGKVISLQPQSYETQFYYNPQFSLNENEILVVAGKAGNIKKFIGE
ncbi:MAG: TrkA family potassium uptake protein [Mangrovibacterium sp.]|nr:TrkA family potassium uptake protein [Mangrovibacterium sp.]